MKLVSEMMTSNLSSSVCFIDLLFTPCLHWGSIYFASRADIEARINLQKYFYPESGEDNDSRIHFFIQHIAEPLKRQLKLYLAACQLHSFSSRENWIRRRLQSGIRMSTLYRKHASISVIWLRDKMLSMLVINQFQNIRFPTFSREIVHLIRH